jgi:hypothetical protein
MSIKALNLESLVFLYALAFLIGYRLLTGGINAKGLLTSKIGRATVRPERVQLLLTTIALAAKYLGDVARTSDGNFPVLDRTWFYAFGSSSGVYLGRKIYERYLQSQRKQ